MPLVAPLLVAPLRIVVSPLVRGMSDEPAALVSRIVPVALGIVLGVVPDDGVVLGEVVVRGVPLRVEPGASFVTRVPGTTSPLALPVVRGARVVSLPVRGVPVVGCCADALPAAPAASATASAAALHGVRRTCIVSS
jgi:hypothetical protein